ACSTWFLPRIVSTGTALEWLYSGELIDAAELKQRGFANEVCTPDELLDRAYAIARRIASFSPVAVALTRQMLYRNAAQPHPMEAHRIDSLAVHHTSQGSGKEGIRAFLEKRPPRFTDTLSRDMPEFYPWWKSG
ncbi:MAG: enoyl-CoA hydratase-related protein, partial [Gammaproteobacteria bacterium]